MITNYMDMVNFDNSMYCILTFLVFLFSTRTFALIFTFCNRFFFRETQYLERLLRSPTGVLRKTNHLIALFAVSRCLVNFSYLKTYISWFLSLSLCSQSISIENKQEIDSHLDQPEVIKDRECKANSFFSLSLSRFAPNENTHVSFSNSIVLPRLVFRFVFRPIDLSSRCCNVLYYTGEK